MIRKLLCILLLGLCLSGLVGCGAGPESTSGSEVNNETEALENVEMCVDLDLTTMSSTMVYSEVSNIMSTPEEYIGKNIKMKGQYVCYLAYDENGEIIPGRTYDACIIADATACCSQGIEFVCTKGKCPALNDECTVCGNFQPYDEDGVVYFHLADAVVQ